MKPVLEATVVACLDRDRVDRVAVARHGEPPRSGACRIGPLRRLQTGLDLAYTMAVETFRESGDPAELPRPHLVEHYVNGEFGQKSGKGWYDYSKK